MGSLDELLDGSLIHRALQNEGIESHVVDAASVSTSWRRRRAKTGRIDDETLVRVRRAYKRGEPRVCAMVKVPTPSEEDRRHLRRERKALTAERVRHVNRIKGFLFSHGICRCPSTDHSFARPVQKLSAIAAAPLLRPNPERPCTPQRPQLVLPTQPAITTPAANPTGSATQIPIT